MLLSEILLQYYLNGEASANRRDRISRSGIRHGLAIINEQSQVDEFIEIVANGRSNTNIH